MDDVSPPSGPSMFVSSQMVQDQLPSGLQLAIGEGAADGVFDDDATRVRKRPVPNMHAFTDANEPEEEDYAD